MLNLLVLIPSIHAANFSEHEPWAEMSVWPL